MKDYLNYKGIHCGAGVSGGGAPAHSSLVIPHSV
jgi:hypothetical protein